MAPAYMKRYDLEVSKDVDALQAEIAPALKAVLDRSRPYGTRIDPNVVHMTCSMLTAGEVLALVMSDVLTDWYRDEGGIKTPSGAKVSAEQVHLAEEAYDDVRYEYRQAADAHLAESMTPDRIKELRSELGDLERVATALGIDKRVLEAAETDIGYPTPGLIYAALEGLRARYDTKLVYLGEIKLSL